MIEELARNPGSPPLATDEIITAGTLAEAMPAVPGESWSTEFDLSELKGLRLKLRTISVATSSLLDLGQARRGGRRA